ncbi:MAG TPA: hypothetical protein VI914_01525, partial [Thermodesulfobacteriota bacterium]|nr:hypothetical protein [Thermodesulfobacteriota bacterium]
MRPIKGRLEDNCMKLSKETIDKMSSKLNLPLGEKQSLSYTTFRLPQETHSAIKDIAQSRNLTLIEFFDELLTFIEECEKDKTINFHNLSPGKKSEGKGSHRVRKSYALKKETAKKLERFIKGKNISRDALVDLTVQILKLLIDHELKEKRKKYPQILKNIIGPFCGKAEDIEKNLEKELGGDDPVSRRFSFIVTQLLSLSHEMEENIKEGS